jgi:hypothetical protein
MKISIGGTPVLGFEYEAHELDFNCCQHFKNGSKNTKTKWKFIESSLKNRSNKQNQNLRILEGLASVYLLASRDFSELEQNIHTSSTDRSLRTHYEIMLIAQSTFIWLDCHVSGWQ